VVSATKGPVTGVKKGLIINVRRCAAILLEGLCKAGAPIGVHHRVDNHNHIIEHRRYFGVRAGYEVVDARQRRIGARGLVAMNRVSHPRYSGKRLDDGIRLVIAYLSRIGQPRDLRFNLIKPG